MSHTIRIARNTLALYFRQIMIMPVSLYTVRVVLTGLGYGAEYSRGYMLFNCYDATLPPYLRRGLVRAVNPGSFAE